MEFIPSHSPFYIEQGGVVSSHLPARSVSVMQVKSTSLSSITALIREVISTAGHHTQKALEATCSGQTVWPAEAQVPFPHHVCGISSFS